MMRWRKRLVAVGMPAALVALISLTGCGTFANGDDSDGSPHALSSGEAKDLLLQLPYRYRFREVDLPAGATGALAGTAVGKLRTIVHFGIAFGTEAQAVSVPRAGVRGYYDYSQGGGFVFTDDLIVSGDTGEQFHTAAQWDEPPRWSWKCRRSFALRLRRRLAQSETLRFAERPDPSTQKRRNSYCFNFHIATGFGRWIYSKGPAVR
jgi:hypothetical protein